MSQDTTDEPSTPLEAARWHRVDDDDLPQEGRVRSVVVDGQSIALSRCGGTYGALENRCPHQGGPLGEGSIEQGWLRCPGTATTSTRPPADRPRASPTVCLLWKS